MFDDGRESLINPRNVSLVCPLDFSGPGRLVVVIGEYHPHPPKKVYFILSSLARAAINAVYFKRRSARAVVCASARAHASVCPPNGSMK